MPSSSKSPKVDCPICLEVAPPNDAESKEWVVLTSCGHVYHEQCLLRWKNTDQRKKSSICAFNCPDLKVTCRPRNDSTSLPKKNRIDAPYIRIFLNEAGINAPSSDAPEASQSQFLLKARPPRELPDVDEDEEEEAEVDEDFAPREGESELDRLRRELRETRNASRDARDAARSLRDEHRALQARVDELETIEADHQVEIATLQAELDGQEDTTELTDELAALTERFEELQAKMERQRARLQTLILREGDWNEREIKWGEERAKMVKELEASGESGQAQIRELMRKVESLEHSMLLEKCKVDRADQERENAIITANKAVEAAEKEAQRSKEKLDEERHRFERQLRDERARSDQAVESEKRRSKGLLGAKEILEKKNKKLHKKLQEKALHKGAILDDEDDEDDDAPPRALAPTTSRIFARTNSSRSHLFPSASPQLAPVRTDSDDEDDMYAPGPSFKVNNNSTLLASPVKRKRERSAFDEDAFDISADVGGGRGGAVEAEDDDSDLEILDAYPANGRGKSNALSISFSAPSTLRPLASHPSLTNSLASSFQPIASSASAPSASTSRFQSGWAIANEPTRKPKLSQSKTDQYLPAFAREGGKQGTLEFGQKKRPKVTAAIKKKK